MAGWNRPIPLFRSFSEMTRASTLLLLFVPLASIAQTSTDRTHSSRAAICGPIRMMARMDDPSKDSPAPAQKVRVTLNNRSSTPIVLERVILYYSGETPTAGAPFESESRVLIGAGQEAFFVMSTTTFNPVAYVQLDSVKYADGSSCTRQRRRRVQDCSRPLKQIATRI
jgi:hypothetical protein